MVVSDITWLLVFLFFLFGCLIVWLLLLSLLVVADMSPMLVIGGSLVLLWFVDTAADVFFLPLLMCLLWLVFLLV